MTIPNKKKIFISAAEPSGDIIAAEVMEHLFSPKISFIGIGGEKMAHQGLQSLFPMSELSIMGFTQILPKLFSILKRIQQTADYILEENPNVVLTVDAYSFHCRLAKKLREKGYKGTIIQYVPPAVWAWKASRAEKMAKYYDHVFCIFPFETSYFEPWGLASTFVGHPAIYRVQPKDPTFKTRFNIPEKAPIITILPGSRHQEIKTLLPIYLEAAKRIHNAVPGVTFCIPTFADFQEEIHMLAKNKGIPYQLLLTLEDKYACFHETSLAIAASGTVALELGSYEVPTIIGYITSPLNYWIAKRFATVKYICSINILADRPIVPEFVQKDCTANNIAHLAIQYLNGELAEDILSRQTITQTLAQLKSTRLLKPQEIVAQELVKLL